MASLYKNNGIWYIAVYGNGKRRCQSLKTKDKKVAKQLKPYAESAIIAELNGYVIKNERLSFAELVPRFLGHKNSWSAKTKRMYRCILNPHLAGVPLPSNLTSRAIHTRVINQCWRWGLKNNLIEKAHYLPGDTKGEARHRTYTADELTLMFANIEDKSFNSFVRFAYYTGARSGEIRSISRDNVLEGSLSSAGRLVVDT